MSACRNRHDALPADYFPEIPADLWRMFKASYDREFHTGGESIALFPSGAGFLIANAQGTESSDVSARWMLFAYSFGAYYRELIKYRNVLKLVVSGPALGVTADQATAILRALPAPNWQQEADGIVQNISARILANINSVFPTDARSADNFKRFLSDRSWSGCGKSFNRGDKDWIGSALKTAARVIHDNSSRLPWVIQAVEEDGLLSRRLKALVRAQVRGLDVPVARVRGGVNVIYYGAPGTGKSHQVDERISHVGSECRIRTVFHSDTQSGDFVGSFRPHSIAGSISYTFQPGPFTTALVRAIRNPESMHFLVIEELNRAAAAAVFGEIFQLLDRDAYGASKYSIAPSDPAHAVYLADHLPGWNGEIRLPSNLTILATMNSSDQAVMPLDTAFKRR